MRYIIVTIIYVFINVGVKANDSEFLPFESFTVDDGLSQGSVLSITQDKYGFIWFGTQNGLNRYDGRNFKIYYNNPADSNTIITDFVLNLYTDIYKNLWIGFDRGLSRYNEQYDNFDHITFEDKKENNVNSLNNDTSGNLIINASTSFYIYDYNNEKLAKKINFNNFEIKSIVYGSVIDKNNKLWINGNNIQVYDLSNNKSCHNKLTEYTNSQKNKDTYHKIAIDNYENIWVVSRMGKILRYNPFIDSLYTYKKPKNIQSAFINALYSSPNGGLWISIDKVGIFRFDYKKDDFVEILNSKSINYDIQNSSTATIYLDNQNILWVGHFKRGVSYTTLHNNKIKHISYNPISNKSLSQNIVSDIFIDSKDRLWVATDGWGLNRYFPENDSFAHYIYEPYMERCIGDNSVLEIFEDTEGNMWFGSFKGGLSLYDEKTNSFYNYQYNPEDKYSIASNDIRNIVEDKNGYLWMTIHGKGIAKFDKSTNKFINYTVAENNINLAGEWTFDLMFDSEDNLWVATSAGISKVNTLNMFVKNYTFRRNDTNSLKSQFVQEILEDSKKRLWFGTLNGLSLFNKENETFKTYTKSDGLINNIINSMLEDEYGNLWISTMEGISCFNPETENFTNYNVNDGLQGNEFFRNSCFKDKNGFLYFGGTNGFNIFHPDSIMLNKKSPNVLITSISLYNEELHPSADNRYLKQSAWLTDEIVLPHDKNFITIEYVALNHISSIKNKYAYKLTGISDFWNNVGNDNKAVFAGLQPGEYEFTVIASNNNNIWNNVGDSIKIYIKPPWWNTLWFKTSLILLAFLMFVLYYFARLSIIKRRNILLSQMVVERTKELNMAYQNIKEQQEELISTNDQLIELNKTKDKFLSIIAHDLKNPINTLLNISDLLHKRVKTYPTEKIEKFSGIINDSTYQIYGLLENLLQWARSQTGKINFQPQYCNLKDLIDQPVALLSQTAIQKHITMSVLCNPSISVWADEFMIVTVLRNLISNAIKFTPKYGKIEIGCTLKNNKVEVSITDSGIGMDADLIKKLFKIDKSKSHKGTDGETGSGLGLVLCNEFISIHGEKLNVNSEPNKGSRFSFYLKISEK